jgi:hypothetical protein
VAEQGFAITANPTPKTKIERLIVREIDLSYEGLGACGDLPWC